MKNKGLKKDHTDDCNDNTSWWVVKLIIDTAKLSNKWNGIVEF